MFLTKPKSPFFRSVFKAKSWGIFWIFLLPISFLQAQVDPNDPWVKSTFENLSLEEKIAQLFMIEVRPTLGQRHLTQVEKTIKKYQVGGLIFFKGTPEKQAILTNKFQNLNKTKMLVAIDGEWGLAMRLSNTPKFPYQMELGGLQNNSLLFEMGKEIGKQCKRIGIHMNLAPVVDINNNAQNPVINFRSFGENPMEVSIKGFQYAQGLQSEKIIACAKHFPGHGDTETDSHKDLPILKHSKERLNELELLPFQYLIEKGVLGIMSAHLYVPNIESEPYTATSISPKAINSLLRKDLHFNGLVITDALNMQGVAKFHQPGELELKALLAGNDILLAPGDIPKSIQLIKTEIFNGNLDTTYLFQKVKKILAYKKWVGLDKYQTIPLENLTQDLNNVEAEKLIEKLSFESICLAANKQKVVPILPQDISKTLFIQFDQRGDFLSQYLSKERKINYVQMDQNPTKESLLHLDQKTKKFEKIVVSLHHIHKYPKNNYGLSKNLENWIEQIVQQKNVLLVLFGNPYSLRNISHLKNLLIAYNNDELHYKIAKQVLFGEYRPSAHLPVSLSKELVAGSQANFLTSEKTLQKLTDSLQSSYQKLFQPINKIAKQAIKEKCTPGCQILLAKNGTILYQKSFGFFTYDSLHRVKNNSLYDLASLTKILATTLAIMKLYEENEIQLHDPLAKHLPFLQGTNKDKISIQEVLTHKAGLQDWIPFYKDILLNAETLDTIFNNIPSEKFTLKNGNGIYMNKNYVAQMIQKIIDSPLSNKGKYHYSDLGMILLRFLVEKKSGIPFNKYLDLHFYQPLQLERCLFNPAQKFSPNEIVPTEINPDHRPGLIHGFVHDPAAAMFGGISGHAGLFSSAQEVAVIMQMLMNGGHYGGTQFLKKKTVEKFTKRQDFDSRRGLGFDKHDYIQPRYSPTSKLASPNTFGHSGFTGTQAWADPNHGLIYIFLSNRVYPSAENKKLIQKNIRTKIMDEAYKATKIIDLE